VNDRTGSIDGILRSLQERAKELNCLYRVDAILRTAKRSLADQLQEVAEALPSGWQHPALCQARIAVHDIQASTTGYRETQWSQSAPVTVGGRGVGYVRVTYTRPTPEADEGPFLKEERRLLDTIADRIGQHLTLRATPAAITVPAASERQEWRVVLELLEKTDQALYRQISRKLLNHLSVSGVREAQALLARRVDAEDTSENGENRPARRRDETESEELSNRAFEIAARTVPERELLSCLHVWIKEDRVNFLVEALESPSSSLPEIAAALDRFRYSGVRADELSVATQTGLKVALIRRLLTDQLDYVNICRQYVELEDLWELLNHTVLLPNSHGRLGGKSSGLFLAAQVIRRSQEYAEILGEVRVPRTWYVPSDGVIQFVTHNDLDDVFNWKFQDVDQIRREYPHLQQVFKSSRFPAELESGLATALDDLGDGPLIVRSSSLLEDRAGAAFSGKYKSLFLANRGTKAERLAALLDAISEVYASVFSPDPIQYRAERGLLVHHEEMGIMIQEVVGGRMGPYHAPAFSGVAFSVNELRWSPRIRREDGLLRLVPGLGTRAVDRLSDDYPVLVAPGQPGLRVNVTPEEIAYYSPRKVDVINLETNAFETVDRRAFLHEAATTLDILPQLVSAFDGETLRRVAPLTVDASRDQLIFTFDGLFRSGSFLSRARALLKLLSDAFGTPVDLEFAVDSRGLSLLQCRPQSYGPETTPPPLPRDVPSERILFSANRHVPNGRLSNLTHVVFVDPDAYARIATLEELRRVGRAVARLNQLLPKRRFALIGPGRWGSRGDIRLGVSVTYADVNNTALLVEVARARGGYAPDPSFGTHFFQDLVEADIRYLPLYPDSEGVVFNWSFFKASTNVLAELLPEHADLAEVLFVIDVPRASGGQVLEVLMNAELDEAVGILVPPRETPAAKPAPAGVSPQLREDHSGWRLRMAERLASELYPGRLGVVGLWIDGSVKSGSAGPESDIDLLVHFRGQPAERRELEAWLDGWSRCLSEMNFLRTGCRTTGLLDARILTDEDFVSRTSHAVKVGAVTDPARPLALGSAPSAGSRPPTRTHP
jgi:hypothetical protein